MISDLIDRPIRAENICYCENRRTLMVDSRRRKPLLPYLWHISLRFSRFLFTIYLLYKYIHNFTRPSDQQQCTPCYHQGKTKVHPVFVVKSYDLNCLLLNPTLCMSGCFERDGAGLTSAECWCWETLQQRCAGFHHWWLTDVLTWSCL